MNRFTRWRSAPVARLSVLASRLTLGLLLAAAALLGGCAVGNQYDYRIASMPLPVKGSGEIGLIVSDQRPYILNKDKTPDFVGLQRGGWGNPFDVRTQSGRPMAQDMAETLKGALEAKGYRVTLLDNDPGNVQALGRQASARGLSRVLVLQIKEWKTDTMMSTRLFYNMQLLIVDPAGKVVAQNSLDGSSAIGGGMPATIGALARSSFENKIGQLFYPPEIRAALGGGQGARGVDPGAGRMACPEALARCRNQCQVGAEGP